MSVRDRADAETLFRASEIFEELGDVRSAFKCVAIGAASNHGLSQAKPSQATSASPERPSAQPEPPARPLLYFFEHVSLREAAFRYDEDIQRLIANPRQAGEPVTRLFAKAALYAAKVPSFKSETAVDDMTRFMRQISFETIRRGGYTIHLMGMPSPEYPPEAYYIAIAYKDGEPLVEGTPSPSTRYIVLEKTQVKGRVFALAEWDVNGSHKTHGFGNQAPTVRGLVGNTFQLLGINNPE